MTPISHDKSAKPKTGCYFPYPANELIPRIEQLGFAVFEYETQKRLRPAVILENCSVECPLGYQLCSFLRQFYIATFSLPHSVRVGLAREAVEITLKELRDIDAAPRLNVKDQQFVVYRAYLRLPETLTVARHVINGQSRSYLKMWKSTQLSKAGRDPDGQTIVVERRIAQHQDTGN